MPAARAFYILPMPTIELTDDELRDSAQALRIAVRQAQSDADAQANPRLQQIFMDGVQRYTALSERFEAAREKRSTTKVLE
jgi:hypothetical protein